MSEEKHQDLTPEENFAKMEKVLKSLKKKLRSAYKRMLIAQDRLRNAVTDNAQDVIKRRFTSDVGIAHSEIVDLLGQLHWAKGKISYLKSVVNRQNEKQAMEACTRLTGQYTGNDGRTFEKRKLIHFPFSSLKDLKLEKRA